VTSTTDASDSYIYNTQDLRAAGHDLLTDDIHIPHRLGQIKIHFEAWSPDVVCVSGSFEGRTRLMILIQLESPQNPRRLTFILCYYKDDEDLHPKSRFINSTRPPLRGYDFVSGIETIHSCGSTEDKDRQYFFSDNCDRSAISCLDRRLSEVSRMLDDHLLPA
jgi:hypothetical protein